MKIDPHPDFVTRKDAMWKAFVDKDYETAARISATILQDSYALDAIHVAGLALTRLDRMDEGFNWCCASLSLADAIPDWYNNAAVSFMDQQDYLHAMVFIQNGLKDYPDNVCLHYQRGLCMLNAQQWDKAIGYFDALLGIDGAFYHANLSKGFCQHMAGRYEDALQTYESILPVAQGVDHEEVINNIACVLVDIGKPYEALALLDREYPNSSRVATLYNRAFLYLGMEDHWTEAWNLFRLRSTVEVKGHPGTPKVDQPLARTLDDLKGRHLFFFYEQGLGDALQFVRYAKLLRPYVSDLTIGVPQVLHRLTEHLILDQGFHVVSATEEKPSTAQCDIAMPFLDAPSLFDHGPKQVPADPYFRIPEEIVNKRLLPDTSKPRIGLCWAGASRPENIRAHSIDKRRSIPFKMLDEILSLHDVFDFVSLQMPDHHVNDPRLLQPLIEGFDVLDTMGVIKQLDLVITIDSAVAHMAGSIGKPVWMLSRYDGCWRWFFDGREDTAWYPTMRIFRQTEPGAWDKVLTRVSNELDKVVENRSYDSWVFDQVE